MLGTYYYHEIIRRTIIAFGTLFNTIDIKHKTQDGKNYSEIRIPVAYGPTEKFLARLEQKPDPRKRVAITLPRIAFELSSISYDNSRKVSTMQTFKAFTKDGSKSARKVFMPVPYNLGFRLSIMSQYNEDALQILEQILPYFQPSFNVTVDLVSSIGEKRDIPMILDNITFDDNYDRGYEEKRVIIHTLDFTAKTYLFGPVADSSEGLIKRVQVDYSTSTNRKESTRELRYVAKPRAIKDYNDDATTVIVEDLDTTETLITVSNASSLIVDSYIEIDNELMFIKKIENEVLTVLRAQDGSVADTHVNGTSVNVVNAVDDALIEVGDDFGFSEERFDFSDFRTYSPSKGIDV
ncbi:hypothetical protein CMO86_09970 [Candidatus Woesearchaeota archaeon]|jgi:hypothetical protein|nr:hypothetical protein [Candidatus Woesearchaeota archaeon]|tara:strand:+ start:6070 stop:7122 length:1053 start_codon:yes stop_codon:yes gene_type:complete